jgi:hypothetical protein
MLRITTGRSGALSPFLHVAGDHVRGDGQGKDDASRETPAFGNIRSMAGFRYPLRSPTGPYLGEFVVAVPDWSEGDTFADKEGRRFRIVSIDPARVLDAIHATWTVGPA